MCQRKWLNRIRDRNFKPAPDTFFFNLAQQPPGVQGLLIHEVSRSHTQLRTTVGRTPLDEWSGRRRDLYLTTHNTHNRQTSMPPVGFEITVSAGERPQTFALDRASTETGSTRYLVESIFRMIKKVKWECTAFIVPRAKQFPSSSRQMC